ncbi:MAG: DUF1080 domain-containing protein [Bryobacterales bacterium]|nr:DUF1080 domain-containing protein [Bryobacterales bacterium]
MNWIATIAFAIAGLLAVTAIEGQEASRSAYSQDPHGWTDLMPKPGLPGWTKVPIPASGKLEPKEQWVVRDGRLIIDGSGGHEWLRYDGKRYKNFILHAEWRFRKQEGTPPYNGGLYFWANADGSQFYQAQTGLAGGWLFGDFPKAGERNRTNLREQMTGNRMAPVGEWNTFEVKATTLAVELWVNGGVQSRWENPSVTEGFLGIEAEGFYMEFRRFAVKDLP